MLTVEVVVMVVHGGDGDGGDGGAGLCRQVARTVHCQAHSVLVDVLPERDAR